MIFETLPNLDILYIESEETERGSPIWGRFAVKIYHLAKKCLEVAIAQKSVLIFWQLSWGKFGTGLLKIQRGIQKCQW